MALHAKAVPAEGRRNEGPVESPGYCVAFSEGEGTIELDQGGTLLVQQPQLWQWAVAASLQPKRLSGDAVTLAPGDRCVAALDPKDGTLQAVQKIVRFRGRIATRPSSSVGQIEPEEEVRHIAGAKVFLRLSEIAGALQLPAVGERVEFQLALNPERADRLWASEVSLVDESTIALTPVGLSTASAAADPRGGASPRGGAPSDGGSAEGTRVYVRNLHPSTEWASLRQLLSAAGDVPMGQLQLDSAGRSRGAAIVQFASAAAAQHAVHKLHLAELDGQRLHLTLMAAGGASAHPSTPPPRQGFLPGRRVYVGRLPADATWRDVQELLQPFGEIVQLQLPRDLGGRPRGFGVVEFATAEAVAAAVRKLEHVELRGHPLVVRDDTQAIGLHAKPTSKVYVGNLSPAVSSHGLKDLMLTGDTSAVATIAQDKVGKPMGFGLVEFRTPAAADKAIRLLHNAPLEGRPIFMRPDVDLSASDEAEIGLKREKLACNLQQMQQLTAWLEAAPPLVEWGWSNGTPSCWALPSEAIAHDRRSLAYAQLCARMVALIPTRMDASLVPTAYERTFGTRLDVKAYGYGSLRELLSDLGLVLDAQGSRLFVGPAVAGSPQRADSYSSDKHSRDGARDRDRKDAAQRERARRGAGETGKNLSPQQQWRFTPPPPPPPPRIMKPASNEMPVVEVEEDGGQRKRGRTEMADVCSTTIQE
ncbi:hypothetical protein AB1Y20_022367 [Prymnesium parvum]|uniref:RRM domain-containing protein n=1 Tax=Prymnesium parvum TaxID=97485 RepID=A0AB34JGQ4_PRYPA